MPRYKQRKRVRQQTQLRPVDIIQGIYHKLPNYWIRNGSGQFEQLGKEDTKSVLRQRSLAAGFPFVRRDQIAEMMAQIALEQSIYEALPQLPGYPIGIHIIGKKKILVPETLSLITPVPGNADLWDQILWDMLGSEQLTYLLAWLKIGYQCLKANVCKPGQVVILVGPKGCGKNLVQEELITPVFGGEIAEPYRYAVGKSPFNSELYEAMHLMIADQKNPADRIEMQEFIRRIASNDFDSFHPKHKKAIGLKILWRMSVSCNEEEKDLRIIPPLSGLEDKLNLLRCTLHPMPMPTATPAEYKAFGDALRAELPAFVHNLLAFKIPDDLHHERFGVKGYMHPELVRMVAELDPEQEALEFIQEAKKANPQINLIDVRAGEIHQKLYQIDHLRPGLLAVAKTPIRLGRLLAKLADRNDGIVIRGSIIQGSQYWTINV